MPDVGPQLSFDDLKMKSKEMRKDILEMVSKTKSSHIGSCYSVVDILNVLYNDTFKNFDCAYPDRDIFILSKGHAAVALYTAMASRGFIPRSVLSTYAQNESTLAGHIAKNCLPGIEATAGSLGHGLPMLAGYAYANKNNKRKFYCLVGDGECNEGSVWEAADFCANFQLAHVTVLIDCNKLQGLGFTKDVLLQNLPEKWSSCGWEIKEIDGHNLADIKTVLDYSQSERNITKPLAIIAHTVKGKGVSWMENSLDWHYKSPNEEQYKIALAEIAL